METNEKFIKDNRIVNIVNSFNYNMKKLEENNVEGIELVLEYRRFIDEFLPIENCEISNTVMLCICNSEYIIFPELWELYDDKEHLNIFLERLLNELIWMKKESIQYSDIKSICYTGEVLAGILNKTKEWIFFQKLRIQLLLMLNCFEEAKEKIVELKEDIPGDPYVNERLNYVEGKIKIKNQKLYHIFSFEEYVECLKYNKNKYIVILVGADTPWGPSFDKEKTYNLMDALGLSTNLYGQFRKGYMAIVKEGQVVVEKLASETYASKVGWEGNINDIYIKVESRGYGCMPVEALVELNKKEYNFRRGISFLVLDKDTCKVEDNVNFDTFTDNCACIREDSLYKALLKWQNEHKDVTLLSCKYPIFPEKNLSEIEKLLYKNKILRGHYFQNLEDMDWLPLKSFFNSDEEMLETITPPKSYHDISGVRRFEDKQGKCVNIISGRRVTTDQPDKYTNTIYVIGGCGVFGHGATDDKTIASYLQRLCNNHFKNKNYIVQNYGFFLSDTGRQYMEEIRVIESLPVKAGDIIVCFMGYGDEIPLIDLSNAAERPHRYGEVFSDVMPHLTPNGYELISDKVFQYLKENSIIIENNTNSLNTSVAYNDSNMDNLNIELSEYKKSLCKLYKEQLSVGSIVMNCNPFTLGHRYLIEQASSQCAHLIVFVVEEDKSIFKFEDRFKLVKEGTKDLKNVTVIKSGKFVLSSLTFSDYFNKSELQDRVVDSSDDINIFAKEIVPCLHITKRFVGTEPFDTVTNQYNEEMKKTLPQYGVEVIEIPRMEQNGIVVSASEVRRLICNDGMNKIKEIVPSTTYKFIYDNFNQIKEDIILKNK